MTGKGCKEDLSLFSRSTLRNKFWTNTVAFISIVWNSTVHFLSPHPSWFQERFLRRGGLRLCISHTIWVLRICLNKEPSLATWSRAKPPYRSALLNCEKIWSSTSVPGTYERLNNTKNSVCMDESSTCCCPVTTGYHQLQHLWHSRCSMISFLYPNFIHISFLLVKRIPFCNHYLPHGFGLLVFVHIVFLDFCNAFPLHLPFFSFQFSHGFIL